jgi:DNA-binding transcriptional ArsR family regulator
MTTLRWDSGTAYDFFISLYVLHHATDFGLRPSWAAGVRQRLSTPGREFLEQVYSFAVVPLNWINHLPEPKDTATALGFLMNLAPADRLAELALPDETPEIARSTLEAVARRGSWTAEEKELLGNSIRLTRKELKPSGLENLLNLWTGLEKSGHKLLSALEEYHSAYFTDEETRVRPALEAGLTLSRELAERISVDALVEELSHGVRFEGLSVVNELTLVPSYWSTPFVFHTGTDTGKTLIVFGCRSEVQSVAPGADASDLLVNALKSLADPTRLRILRFLSEKPRTPTELSILLRLRPPTVIHHLRALRLAQMVTVRVGENNEKRYAARLEALDGVFTSVRAFIEKQD